MVNLIKEYDLFCVQETKLDTFDIISIPDYKFISKPRGAKYIRKSGGLGIFVKDWLCDHIDILESKNDYVLWLKIRKSLFRNLDQDFVIGTIYIPPEQSKFFNEDEIFDLQNEIFTKCTEFTNILTIGDFNGYTANNPDYADCDEFLLKQLDYDYEIIQSMNVTEILSKYDLPVERFSKDKKQNRVGNVILDICKNNNMFIVNGRVDPDRSESGEFTFKQTSVIDYAIVTLPILRMCSYFHVEDVDDLFSDGHSVLSLTLDLTCLINIDTNHSNFVSHAINGERSLKRPPKWRPDLRSSFNENINLSNLHEINVMLDSIKNEANIKTGINMISNKIASLFSAAAFSTFPVKSNEHYRSSKQSSKPWYGPQCEKARRKYNLARKKYALHKNDLYKRELNTASRFYKQTLNTYIKKHKFNNERKLREMHTKRPKDYWKILNSFKTQNAKQMPSLDDFYHHFNKENDSTDSFDHEFNLTPSLNTGNEILNSKITAEEITKMISKSKNSKAASPQDFIFNEYLKSTKDIMIPVYCKLFNAVLDTGSLPESWLIGTIKPIYKGKGTPLLPENYRPITILSCLGKLFTAIINERISKFLKVNHLLKENQAGFRAGYSTSDHIFALKFLIDKLRFQKKKLFVAYIDFSSAFDKIWRAGLWQKIFETGIDGKIFNIIRNMYADIKSCVSLNNSFSPFFKSVCGVRQGENLSPILFALYMNDLDTYLRQNNRGLDVSMQCDDFSIFLKLFVLLYADDTIIVSEDPTSFQQLLNDFSEYCKIWKLDINMNKTKVMIFGTNKPSNYHFSLGGKELEIVKQYKYLGVTFTSSGSFLEARKNIVSQANKAMHLLFTRLHNLDLPVDLQLKLFDQTILPILTYNCENWGFENLEIIERIHTDFLRQITKSKKSTPNYMLYAELGRFPLDIIIKTRMIKYWCKLVGCHETKISRICYDYMYRSPDVFKWINKLKSILDHTGNTVTWLNQNPPKNFDKTIKRNLIDQFLQQWSEQTNNSSKGINYRIYKEHTNFEDYLKILPQNLRLSLFHFRTGNHKLPIETMRWRQNYVPYEQRRCLYCTLHDSPDEFHYLFKCPIFTAARKKYLPRSYFTRPNTHKFKELFNAKSPKLLRNISIFVRQIINFFNTVN
jgi:hypothetical protein